VLRRGGMSGKENKIAGAGCHIRRKACLHVAKDDTVQKF
jgi:hypothetical protein